MEWTSIWEIIFHLIQFQKKCWSRYQLFLRKSNIFIEFMLDMINQVLDDVILQVNKANAETSEYVKKMLDLMEYDIPYTSNDIMVRLGLKSKETLRKNYINPAIELGMIRMTIPDKPNSKNQRYVKV